MSVTAVQGHPDFHRPLAVDALSTVVSNRQFVFPFTGKNTRSQRLRRVMT